MNFKTAICSLNLSSNDSVPEVAPSVRQTSERLLEAFGRLMTIEMARNHRQDPAYGKSVEAQLVWRELIDLELQEIDERVDRILSSAGEKLRVAPRRLFAAQESATF